MRAKAIALTISLVFVAAAAAFADSPHMGTWKLNEAKSKLAGKARNNTVVYAAEGDQIKITVDGVDENGNPAHNEWTGKFDGKPYPVTGDTNADTRTYTQLNSRTLVFKNQKNGKVTVTGRVVISRDGKSRTVTTTATNAQGKKVTNTSLYDKQ
jgi:phage gp45-like